MSRYGYLISYAYYADTDLDDLAGLSGTEDLTFFADSGAYTAHTLGLPISLEGYAAWIERWRHRIHAYASLDVLFDAEGTRRNHLTLCALGLDPVPVFHLGSPLRAFEGYLAESPYVALGGLAAGWRTMRDPKLWSYLDRLHGLADAAGVKLHGFGLSAWPVIRAFPWHSVDSSTPCVGFRWGQIMVFDPYSDTWRVWRIRDRRAWHRYGWLVREYEMTWEDFDPEGSAALGSPQRQALTTLAARSWKRAAMTVPDCHLYIVDTITSKLTRGRRPQMGWWEDGNRWTPPQSGPGAPRTVSPGPGGGLGPETTTARQGRAVIEA
jgi:hypothetical protein